MDITHHGAVRMSQRATTPEDLHLIEQFGTPVKAGYVMRAKDVAEAVAQLKDQIARLERLRGHALIVKDNHLISTYVASRPKQRKMLSGRTG